MASALKALAAVFLVAVALSLPGVSAQTHHVVGGDNGWGPDLNVSSWLLGRVFSVGDKIWFKYSGAEDAVVELKGLEEFVSCNLTNPIKMYTDPVSHVVLEREGVRYFTSGNPERCRNGLKLPVPVRGSDFDPPFPDFSPPFEPYTPETPTPPFDPPVPHFPPPSPPYEPPVPVRPPPSPSAAATYLNGLSLVVFAGWLICYVSI